MRARNVKPGFFKNEELGKLKPLTRLLFLGLWMIADKEGRMEDRPTRIKKEIFPHDSDKYAPIEPMLNALAEHDFIVRYQIGNQKYIAIKNFKKHQRPHNTERASEIPPPPEPVFDQTSGQPRPNLGVTSTQPQGNLGVTSPQPRPSLDPTLTQPQKITVAQQGVMESDNAKPQGDNALIHPFTDSPNPDPLIHGDEEVREKPAPKESPPDLSQGPHPGFGGRLSEYFRAEMATQEEWVVAGRLCDEYQRQVKTSNYSGDSKRAALELIATGQATEEDLLLAIKNYAAHVVKRNSEPKYRMSASTFFGKTKSAWRDWLRGSPVGGSETPVFDADAEHRKTQERFKRLMGQ